MPVIREFLLRLLLGGALLAAVGCGGGGGSSSTTPPPPVVSVVIAPATLNLGSGASTTFTATVSGSSNQAVTWSVQESGGGTITTAGVYTAPATAGTYHVVAASQADSTKSATAAVTVFLGGTVRVYQTGLPTGSFAPIQITGPSGYTATMTQADQSFTGLAAGTYSFTYPNVSAAGAMFMAMEGAGASKTLTAGGTVFFGVSYAPQAPMGMGSMTPTSGSTTDTHIDLAAMKLQSGRVLIIGGMTVTCEEFDPSSGAITAVGSLGTSRGFETPAVMLGNGQVLVAGGGYPGPIANAELYSPGLKTWAATGAMLAPRFHHTLTLLQDGRVLAVGGSAATSDSGIATAELYNPVAGTWSATAGPMSTSRRYHTATLLANGKVLVAGGQGPSGALDTAELFDPATGMFTPLGSHMASAHYYHSAVALPSGQVLLAGGFGVGNYALPLEVFTPATGLFTSPASLLVPRSYLGASMLADGRVFINGGMANGDATASTEIFNPSDASIHFGPNLSMSRQEHVSVALAGGQVFIVGGRGLGNVARKACDLFTP